MGWRTRGVYVLDPCCGTGAYVLEVLRKIEKIRNKKKLGDAVTAEYVREAAAKRVFGFEIMAAPLVIAHYQVGDFLRKGPPPPPQGKNASEPDTMASIYLTNALTGWYDEEEPPLPLREFKKEWKRAQKVKQKRPILVIIGNPPYRLRSSAKMDGSEKNLIAPYKDGRDLGITIRNPRAIHDLYVKFFRVAERRINETGKGVMCYISNYSYASEESFPIMRKHLMASFDKIWIDSMNGSLGRNNMKTPEGLHDPSVFTTPYSTGITTGTAIGLFVKKSKKDDDCEVRFRDFWGEGKRDRLLESLGNTPFDEQYELTQQDSWNDFRFSKSDENQGYLSWPTINDLPGHKCLTGANEARNEACIHIDRDVVKKRMKIYFDKSVDGDEFKRINHEMIVERSRYDAIMDRNTALEKEIFKSENLVRMLCGPFDVRWAYHAETGRVWAFKNDKFRIHMKYGDGFLATRRTKRCGVEGFPGVLHPVPRQPAHGPRRFVVFPDQESVSRGFSET